MTTETWTAEDDRKTRSKLSSRAGWLDDMAVHHRLDEAVQARYEGIAEALRRAGESHSVLMRLRAVAGHPDRPAALSLIHAERERQKIHEGYDPWRDDEHEDGAILVAARCYLDHVRGPGGLRVPGAWPWEPEMWKPTDRTRALVKAGALAQAEIERIRRAGGVPVAAAELLELVLWELVA